MKVLFIILLLPFLTVSAIFDDPDFSGSQLPSGGVPSERWKPQSPSLSSYCPMCGESGYNGITACGSCGYGGANGQGLGTNNVPLSDGVAIILVLCLSYGIWKAKKTAPL